jgi:hypothetical protein
MNSPRKFRILKFNQGHGLLRKAFKKVQFAKKNKGTCDTQSFSLEKIKQKLEKRYSLFLLKDLGTTHHVFV